MRKLVRVLATLAVTGACTAYILWKIDLGKTGHVLASTRLGWLGLSVLIMVASVWPMAWRWRRLLAARGIHERLRWLVRAYFTAYAVGQVLPTALGGDPMRMFETSRRHPGFGGPIAGSVLLERAMGGVATLVLAAAGFALAIGRYDIGAYLWVEASFVVAAIAAGVVLFARSARVLLVPLARPLRALRLDRPARELYLGLHSYREHGPLLAGMLALTVAVQSVRILAIWSAARAAGVDLSARPFYVMGPLLFLVQLVPFTINGLAVRESLFVSFLGQLGVGADAAFASGFLFFLVTVALSLPGVVILGKEAAQGTLAMRPARLDRR